MLRVLQARAVAGASWVATAPHDGLVELKASLDAWASKTDAKGDYLYGKQKQHAADLERQGQAVGQLKAAHGRVEARVAALEQQQQQQGGGQSGAAATGAMGRLDEMAGRLERVDGCVTKLTGQLSELVDERRHEAAILEGLSSDVHETARRLMAMEGRVEGLAAGQHGPSSHHQHDIEELRATLEESERSKADLASRLMLIEQQQQQHMQHLQQQLLDALRAERARPSSAAAAPPAMAVQGRGQGMGWLGLLLVVLAALLLACWRGAVPAFSPSSPTTPASSVGFVCDEACASWLRVTVSALTEAKLAVSEAKLARLEEKVASLEARLLTSVLRQAKVGGDSWAVLKLKRRGSQSVRADVSWVWCCIVAQAEYEARAAQRASPLWEADIPPAEDLTVRGRAAGQSRSRLDTAVPRAYLTSRANGHDAG